MSESQEGPKEFFSVRASSAFEGDEEALEALVQLKELDFGDIFNNRDTQLDTDEGETLSINFSHDSAYNSLRLSTSEESNVGIALSLTDEHMYQAETVLQKLSENIDGMAIDIISIYTIFDVHFTNLNLPIREDTDLHIIGLRVEQNDREYIIQESDEEQTAVNMMIEEPEGDTETVIDNIAQRAVENVTEFFELFN